MKLLITIVQDQDAGPLMDRLTEEGFQFTKVSTTGGFLREGNTTLFIGVEETKMNQIHSLIEENSSSRERQVENPNDSPTMLTVGGAMIFVLDVERVTSF